MKPKLLIAFVVLLFRSAFAQAPPWQASGYQLVFNEDFTKFDLSANGYGAHTWYPGIFFQSWQPLPGAISVSDSTLDLQWDRSSGESGTSMQSCAFDASYCTTFRYGYFEARMKWDVTNGAWPAFWMGTKQSILGAQHVGELDIFEGQGNDPTHFYGTINEWNGASDLVSTNSPNNNRFALPASNDFSQWHTYGLLWVPGKVTWYYDDQPVGTAPTPAIFDQQDFFFFLSSQEGNHWTYGNLTDVTAQNINLHVQWVHVFQPASTGTHVEASTRIAPLSNAVPESVSSGQAVNMGVLPPSQDMQVTLMLPLQNTTALTTLLQQISSPASTSYRQYLSPSQFAANFGASQTDYTAVVAWAQAKGLTIVATSPSRTSVVVSGPVSLVEQAFQVTMNSYQLDGGEVFFAPDRQPTMDLSVPLQGISGLTSLNLKSPMREGSPQS